MDAVRDVICIIFARPAVPRSRDPRNKLLGGVRAFAARDCPHPINGRRDLTGVSRRLRGIDEGRATIRLPHGRGRRSQLAYLLPAQGTPPRCLRTGRNSSSPLSDRSLSATAAIIWFSHSTAHPTNQEAIAASSDNSLVISPRIVEAMDDDRRKLLEATLAAEQTHRRWEQAFRTVENERFYELVFGRVEREFRSAGADRILDAGCGVGAHSVRLARRGFNVTAVDMVPATLALATQTTAEHDVQDRVSVSQEDITSLSFRDGSFRGVLCWGVLMHVPDVDDAISELARVLAPGGALIVTENNGGSPEAKLRRIIRRLRRRGRGARTPAGDEYWKETDAGPLLIRHSDIPWLIRTFEQQGLQLRARLSSGFSELHVALPLASLRGPAHAWNRYWYEHQGDPRLAFGNILIFTRPQSQGEAASGSTRPK